MNILYSGLCSAPACEEKCNWKNGPGAESHSEKNEQLSLDNLLECDARSPEYL